MENIVLKIILNNTIITNILLNSEREIKKNIKSKVYNEGKEETRKRTLILSPPDN